MPTINKLLTIALKENTLTLDANKQNQLVHYLQLLTTWNKTFNLTSITEPQDMVYLHILDSLAVLPFLQGRKALDIGSGAGLPGIPLAIANPEQHWMLLDKNGKKTRFLTQVIAELSLKNVTVIHDRGEHFQSFSCFDSIVSRAFGTIRLFIETTEHLLCPNGIFIAMKGKYPEEELTDIPARFVTKNVTRLAIKGIAAERHIVCLSHS